MPTYDYVCDGCGHAFELFQSMTEEPKKTCPKCKKKKLRRLIGAGAALVFKGSGFYKTDYRSESYKKGAAKDSGKDSGGSKGSDSTGSASSGSAGSGSAGKGSKSSGGESGGGSSSATSGG
jgi:putative FmdB family regulatory protein